MFATTSPAYKCWRCLARTEFRGQAGHRASLAAASRTQHIARRHGYSKAFATVHHSSGQTHREGRSPGGELTQTQGSKADIPIRERLRVWEAENPLPVQGFIDDRGGVGAKRNVLTRAMNMGLADVEFDLDAADNYQPLYEGDDLVDLRSSASDIQPGDLIELTAETQRVQVLAVCLGTFNGYQHFYTSNGKWFTSSGIRSLFVVKNFVDKKTVQKVVDVLPSTAGSPELLNVLQELKAGPSREMGASLLDKMEALQREARLVYQSSAAKLDNAYKLFAGTERLLTLSGISDVLLHPGLRVKGRFSTAALYAVHLALMQSDPGFRPASALHHSKSYLFTVTSQADMAIVEKMEYLVRGYLRRNAKLLASQADEELEKFAFGQFILKARRAIDDSRSSRSWSPHGMLEPAHSASAANFPQWTTDDLEVIKFMHMWAATQKFGAVSRFHSIAATVLRALDRYQDAEYLAEDVGWTFLQEIGWIKPWEIQSRYRLHLPGVELERGGGAVFRGNPDEKLLPDVFAGHRKEFNTRCFCIDAESAADIDDGISLEPTETPGQYWIHVHVADPASRVRPDSSWADHAAALTQTTYLHGHYARMFDDDAIRNEFSLATDKVCLTFSAKVDEDGNMLDSTVTPGVLRDVTYVTPKVVAEICGDEPWSPPGPRDSFTVGNRTKSSLAPNRTMVRSEDLSAKDVGDLKILSRLAVKMHSRRLENGAVPYFPPRPAAEVSFDSVDVVQSPQGFMRCNGDPSIHISYGGNSGSILVASIMQLAGEVAAQWCKSREIPIPFRVQPRATDNEELLRAFADAAYPKLRAGKPLSSEEWRTFLSLSGGTDISTQPAPNFAMGIQLYTKATSPLRRYADLLVHWQIEAALLKEQRLGRRLRADDDQAFLPFSRARLEEEVFPMLRVREQHAKLMDRTQGNKEWMLQALLRAWKFGESADLPKTFRFTVGMVIMKKLVKGTLDWFDMDALMEPRGMAGVEQDGKHITLADVKVGDVYDVELSDVNVYMRRITVKALRRVEEARR